MDILLTNYGLDGFAGTQTYLYSLALVLSKKHKVHVFAIKHGVVSKKMSEFAKIILNFKKNAAYDLILINHRPCLEKVINVDGPKIYTSHGPTNDLENPKGLERYVDAIVAVSEEVQKTLVGRGMRANIIANGVDCNRFYCSSSLSRVPSVLCLCKDRRAIELVAFACQHMGLSYRIVHYDLNPRWDIENAINESDIVISLGRGAIEAMACGRNVIVLDSRDYISQGLPSGDGLLSEQNILQSGRFNYSGRFSRRGFDVATLCSEIEMYDPRRASFYRNYVLQNHNIENIAESYLNLAQELVQ